MVDYAGAVERNAGMHQEALERARIRNNSSHIPASPPTNITELDQPVRAVDNPRNPIGGEK